MDNYAIADQLSLLSKLMDIHGENPFKSKSYSGAAFTIEKLPQPITTLPPEKLIKIKGIGESVGQKVLELIDTGELQVLKELVAITPEGVLEMMNIRGLGPKKIHTIWKEMRISTIEELKVACLNKRIAEKKGFGEKTQQSILEEIQFQENNVGKVLYAQIEYFVDAFQQKFKDHFPDHKIEVVGEFRRQLEIIDNLEWVTTAGRQELTNFLLHRGFELVAEKDTKIIVQTDNNLQFQFFLANEANFFSLVFEKSCSKDFYTAWRSISKEVMVSTPGSEEEIFQSANLPYIPPFLREKKSIIERIHHLNLPDLVQTSQIKGLIHSHSNWSDGAYTIEDMAQELKNIGFEYMVISDHSKAAYYANGLSEERIREQHFYIDSLNAQLAPFKIFKSIECDILNDGTMDYPDKILATFDMVIASIHSNLNMDEDKAMKRILGAITNPYVTMLGHLSGRRLLIRRPYPLDYKTVIDACAEHKVVIEVNAFPERLDIDWRWIDYALEKGVLLSINSDAHSLDDFKNLKYGVLAAQKGGLTNQYNVSSFGLEQFESFLKEQKMVRASKV
ncbi:helix-hairpin-helix domain-containing protein [Chitinophagaceae bacterium LB-8]|uniref:Helix-hairpin-helix domain-containing protein n=1 Tax=Paraflavisolibacter caeni TaxID=2982496 RepID=A0A9X2Y0P9_9BACT|nr:helix-hairpin-helix domain-containing protein [Paraflavisolibacter caeni]MCU7552496.1 helix-hairpin-helix domain-containing protein [Paraflavisolibacter caeni]